MLRGNFEGRKVSYPSRGKSISFQIVKTGGLFPGVTRPEREFYRSPPSTAEV